ncbi:MAG: hypothetical protein ACXWT0_00420 [Methylobacter sp.]
MTIGEYNIHFKSVIGRDGYAIFQNYCVDGYSGNRSDYIYSEQQAEKIIRIANAFANEDIAEISKKDEKLHRDSGLINIDGRIHLSDKNLRKHLNRAIYDVTGIVDAIGAAEKKLKDEIAAFNAKSTFRYE